MDPLIKSRTEHPPQGQQSQAIQPDARADFAAGFAGNPANPAATSGFATDTARLARTLARVAARLKDRRLIEVARVLRGGAPSLELEELSWALVEATAQADPGEVDDLLEAERLLGELAAGEGAREAAG